MLELRRVRLQRRQQRDEGLDDRRVEALARLLLEQRDRGVVRHRLVVRPLRHQGVEVVDDRQDAGAERNRFAPEPARIALAVPPLVMAEDQRRDRIRERHRADDVGADLRMGADLLELFRRQRPRLREDVLGHRQLADVVQQRCRLDALDLVVRHAHGPGDGGGIELDAADVRLRGLVLGVDGEGQRFDRRQVQVRHLADVALLVLDAPEVDLVGAVGEDERRQRQRRDPVRRQVDDQPGGDGGGAGADEVARRAPEEVLVPDLQHRLPRRQRDRRRDRHGVDDEVGRGGADQRLRQLGEIEGAGNAAETRVGESGRLHRDHQAGHAEQRPMQRRCARSMRNVHWL